jgi:hypothetical protein
VKPGDLEVRSARPVDRSVLAAFRCSTGDPWEDAVQEQVRGPLASRYLSAPAYFDGRLLLGFDTSGTLLVLGAHHIEPTMVPDIGYTEVVAVSLDARGALVDMPDGDAITLGHFMLLTIFRQMVRLGRHRRTFARVDRRNARLLDRVGLVDEYDDPQSPELVQRWGTLPS